MPLKYVVALKTVVKNFVWITLVKFLVGVLGRFNFKLNSIHVRQDDFSWGREVNNINLICGLV